ncbi:radical SAM protein [Clostridiaceae bacterium M8S5]|nr:radical SAM protein [Clostridiaceae bacterium M8S5]
MVNKEYIETFHFGGNVLIYNRESCGVIIISEPVYEEIKNVTSITEIEEIAKDYDEDSKNYFKSLINEMETYNILMHNPSKKIELINFAITDYCNLHCTHCCYAATYVKGESFKEKITVDMNLIKRIVELEPLGISITGGEPLLVTNFDEALSFLKNNYKGSISLATNATLINKENVGNICKYFDSFDISLDGVDEETCDSIRGQGTFEKVIAAIKLLKNHGASYITLSMTFDNNTIKLDQDFIELCKKLDVKPKIRTMNLVGRAKDNHIDSDEIVQFMSGGIVNCTSAYDCPGGVTEIFVNSKGEVYPCPLFNEEKYKIGSLYDEDITSKFRWDKNLDWFKEFSEFIPDTREECSDCEIKALCWNCPSLAKSYLENANKSNLSDHCMEKRRGIIEAIENA